MKFAEYFNLSIEKLYIYQHLKYHATLRELNN
jgi:hypothetical protein